MTTPTAPDLLSQDVEAAGAAAQEAAPPSSTNYVAMESATSSLPPSENESDENVDDDHVSVVSSVLTAEGIHDTTGFAVVCLVILVGDMCRGIFFPSMWPLVDELGGSQVTLGFAVASFSFGRILVNPLFGSWSHTMGYSTTINISVSILIFGTLLYATVPAVGRSEFLIVAQTVLGVGSGTLGVTRAFVADVTAQHQRTTYMAWITAVQYAGFTVTPLLGAAFNSLFSNEPVYWFGGLLPVSMFTAPAYFMTIVTVATLVILLTRFRNRQRIHIRKPNKTARKSLKRQEIDRTANTTTWIGLTVYDCCILGCMLLNVSTKGSIASFETIGIVVAEQEFGLTSPRAGLIVGTCGALGVVSLLSMGHFCARYSDIQLISGGMLVMAAGVALLTSLSDNNAAIGNPLWKYVVAIFLIYSIGYPIGHTAVIGMFSKSTYSGLGVFAILVVDVGASLLLTFLLFQTTCTSRRTTAPRHALGLVCLGRILGAHDFPHHVGIHFQIRQRAMLVWRLGDRLGRFHDICGAGPANADPPFCLKAAAFVTLLVDKDISFHLNHPYNMPVQR